MKREIDPESDEHASIGKRLSGLSSDISSIPEVSALVGEIRSLLDVLEVERELLTSDRRAVAAERERLRQLCEFFPDACLITGETGSVLEANRAALRLFGQRDENFRGYSILNSVVEGERAQIQNRLRECAGTLGSSIECELTIVDAGGVQLPVTATVLPFADETGSIALRWLLRARTPRQPPAGPLGMQLIQEQSARAFAEAAQRRDAFLAEASEILAGSLDYEITLGSISRLAVPRIADSCIAYVIDEERKVHGLGVAHEDPAKEEILRRLLVDRPFDLDSLTPPVARALRTGEVEILPDVPPYEAYPMTSGVGEIAADDCPRSLMVVPLKVHDRVFGALSFGWNVAREYTPDDLWLARKLGDRAALAVENARLHREVRRASEAKSDFVAGMSHEFRTPLAAIVAFADLLVAGIPEPITGVPLRQAERILASARHLGELIDQVLTLARIESGRERAQIETFDLALLITDTANLVEPLARQKGLTLLVEVPEGAAVFASDPNKLRQVLFNLLGNAIKFTEEGEIRVTLQTHDDGVALQVRDTGEGISPEHMEQIWEPFWRGSSTTPERPTGTGLGLGIVRRLVRILGGEIRVSSEPGQGSTFTVELRVEPSDS